MKKLFLILFFLIGNVISFAGQSFPKSVVSKEEDRFHGQEWKIDVGVAGAAGVYGGTEGGGIGGNLGINYYLTRYLGIDVDNTVGAHWPTSDSGKIQAVNNLQADLLIRYPISSWNIAFYTMVGGGSSFSGLSLGNGNIGIGTEYRFSSHIGLFADCRWLYGDANIAFPRVGLSFIF